MLTVFPSMLTVFLSMLICLQDEYAQAQAIEAVSKPDKAMQYLEREQEGHMAPGDESTGDSADKAFDGESQPEAEEHKETESGNASCSEHSSGDEQSSASEDEKEEEEEEGGGSGNDEEEECSPSDSGPREDGTGSVLLPTNK